MPDPYRILVTGSREWDAEGTLRQALIAAVAECPDGTDPVIVHGACPRGADAMADRWARDYGFPAERHLACWERQKRRAGFARNEHMVSLGADLCLAFILPCTDLKCRRKDPHGSHGATHCAGLAEKAGIPVRRFTAQGAAHPTHEQPGTPAR
jgi:hypothetical protein